MDGLGSGDALLCWPGAVQQVSAGAKTPISRPRSPLMPAGRRVAADGRVIAVSAPAQEAGTPVSSRGRDIGLHPSNRGPTRDAIRRPREQILVSQSQIGTRPAHRPGSHTAVPADGSNLCFKSGLVLTEIS